MSIPSICSSGIHSHLALTIYPSNYTAITTAALIDLTHPSSSTLHLITTTGPQITETNRKLTASMSKLKTYSSAKENLKKSSSPPYQVSPWMNSAMILSVSPASPILTFSHILTTRMATSPMTNWTKTSSHSIANGSHPNPSKTFGYNPANVNFLRNPLIPYPIKLQSIHPSKTLNTTASSTIPSVTGAESPIQTVPQPVSNLTSTLLNGNAYAA